MRTHLVLFFALAACAGCAHTGAPKTSGVTPSELNTHPHQYHEKNVLIRGYMTLAPEAHNLYESRKLALEFERRWDREDPTFDPAKYDNYCLTIANPDELMSKREALNGTTITVKGKFLADYLDGKIDLGACPLPTAIVVDMDDLRRRYPSIFTN